MEQALLVFRGSQGLKVRWEPLELLELKAPLGLWATLAHKEPWARWVLWEVLGTKVLLALKVPEVLRETWAKRVLKEPMEPMVKMAPLVLQV